MLLQAWMTLLLTTALMGSGCQGSSTSTCNHSRAMQLMPSASAASVCGCQPPALHCCCSFGNRLSNGCRRWPLLKALRWQLPTLDEVAGRHTVVIAQQPSAASAVSSWCCVVQFLLAQTSQSPGFLHLHLLLVVLLLLVLVNPQLQPSPLQDALETGQVDKQQLGSLGFLVHAAHRCLRWRCCRCGYDCVLLHQRRRWQG